MNVPERVNLIETIRRLHREKDAAYRDAWKRRGEVISILANLARKVDRLEHVLDGAPAGDESIVDTAVDLLVYCLKYEAFLADIDADVALRLFGPASQLSQPYSDGTGGFEYLLDDLQSSDFEGAASLPESVAELVSRFNDLAACFTGVDTARIASDRLEHVRQLACAAVRLLGALSEEYPSSLRRFQDVWLDRGV